MRDTRPLLLETDFPPVCRSQPQTLQVNLGYLCNLSCVHCHVDAGPHRTEQMSIDTIGQVLSAARELDVTTLDLTGGAPELNPHFRYLVSEARAAGIHVIDRCNLTVLYEPGQEDLAEFLAQSGVQIVASLPCYEEENVSAQRGKGVYDTSIDALRRLNTLGYGDSLPLNLVYNPVGPTLPPPQAALEADYRHALGELGIRFSSLFTITNMPISRFGAVLLAKGQYVDYMRLLRDNYSDATMQTLMCRELLSVDWRGYLYDCDFNQMLDMPVIASDQRLHVSELSQGQSLAGHPVATGEHCYGCAAGQGSSCGGALGAG